MPHPSNSSAYGIWSLNEVRDAERGDNWPEVFKFADQVYTTPGSYTYTPPVGATHVSVVAVGGGGAGDDGNSGDGGGGGGAGGALAFANSVPITGISTISVVVGSGGAATSVKDTKAPDGGDSTVTIGTYVLTAGGGDGGSPYNASPGASPSTFSHSNTPSGVTTGGGAGGGGGAGFNGGGGGGGAGGYNDRGGQGSNSYLSTGLYTSGQAGAGNGSGGGGGASQTAGAGNNGGGDGGAGQNDVTGGGGGGANLFSLSTTITDGSAGNGSTSVGSQGGAGGFPGGGGGGSWDSNRGLAVAGGDGAVRIIAYITGNTKEFPTGATGSGTAEF